MPEATGVGADGLAPVLVTGGRAFAPAGVNGVGFAGTPRVRGLPRLTMAVTVAGATDTAPVTAPTIGAGLGETTPVTGATVTETAPVVVVTVFETVPGSVLVTGGTPPLVTTFVAVAPRVFVTCPAAAVVLETTGATA